MKEKIRIQYDAVRTEEREINYIPLRYILALLLAVLETVMPLLQNAYVLTKQIGTGCVSSFAVWQRVLHR